MQSTMREETRKRLERALWMQRLKWVGGGLAVAAFIGGGLWLTGIDASIETTPVAGVIERIGPLNGTSTKAIEEGLAVDVKLEDGRLAHVMAYKTTDPHVGDHVKIAEHHHGSGRVTFSWK
jgi:hypothetical protein